MRSRRWLIRAFALAALLTGLVVVARWWVVDFARVSSPSMAPLLLGSPTAGDDVLFVKRAFVRDPWRRYDLAVYGAAEAAAGLTHPVPTIKRMVGLPHEIGRAHV